MARNFCYTVKNMKKSLKFLVFICLAITGAALIYFSGLWSFLQSWLTPESLKNFIGQFGIAAPLVFIGLYYVLTLAFISAAAFTVLSGLLFGKVWGTLYVIVAATAAAQTAFYLARSLGSKKLEGLKQKKGIGKTLQLVEKKCAQNGFRNLVIMRCLFLPYMPLSYAAGMIKTIKPLHFLAATLLTNLVFSPAFVFLGDSLLKGPQALVLPIAMITLVLLVPKIVKKFHTA